MDKLELKYFIDAYRYQYDIYGSSDIWKIVKLSDKIITLFNGVAYVDTDLIDFNVDYSIILKPLSCITKEDLNILFRNNDSLLLCFFHSISKERFLSENISYNEMLDLIKKHFDVFGLIEKGLAIDINTLNS